jgi:hypothetical protein
MTSESGSLRVFRSFIEHGAGPFLTDFILKRCQHQREVIEMAQQFIFTDLSTLIVQNDISSLSTVYDLVVRSEGWTPAVILTTSVFVQLDGSEIAFEALRFTRRMIQQGPLPDSVYGIMKAICGKTDPSILADVVQGVLRLLHNAFSVQAFSVLFRLLVVLATTFPKDSKAVLGKGIFNQELLPLVRHLSDQPDGAEQFGEYIGAALEATMAMAKRDAPPPWFLFKVLNFAVLCVELGANSITNAIVAFLQAVTDAGLLAIARPHTVHQILKLLYRGDAFWQKISSVVLPVLPLDGLTDQAAKFWLAVVEGDAELGPAPDPEVVESLKVAAVFGGAIALQKISLILSTINKPKKGEKSAFLVDFIGFLLQSNEVDKAAVSILVPQLERLVGKNVAVEEKPQVLYRKTLADLGGGIAVRGRKFHPGLTGLSGKARHSTSF